LVGAYLLAALSDILRNSSGMKGHVNVAGKIQQIAFAPNVLLAVKQATRIVIITQF
jgi:hypothetical protein